MRNDFLTSLETSRILRDMGIRLPTHYYWRVDITPEARIKELNKQARGRWRRHDTEVIASIKIPRNPYAKSSGIKFEFIRAYNATDLIGLLGKLVDIYIGSEMVVAGKGFTKAQHANLVEALAKLYILRTQQ